MNHAGQSVSHGNADSWVVDTSFSFDAPPGTTSVHLWMNRFTDKQRTHLGVMLQVAGSRTWRCQLRLPANTVTSYCFVVDGTPGRTGNLEFPHFRDPHAPVIIAAPGGRGLSLYAGPAAPDFSAWQGRGGSGQLHYRTPGHTAVPLIVVCDADLWMQRLGLAEVIADEALGFPPVAIWGMPCGNDRKEMFTQPLDIDSIVRDAERHLGITIAGKPIVVGHSLGGLCALRTALEDPTKVHAAIAMSPSLWWHPTEDGASPASPAELEVQHFPWLASCINPAFSTPRNSHANLAPRIMMSVGLQEGGMVNHSIAMQQAFHHAGWAADLDFYQGGHDIAWWQHALLTHLRQALQEHAGTTT